MVIDRILRSEHNINSVCFASRDYVTDSLCSLDDKTGSFGLHLQGYTKEFKSHMYFQYFCLHGKWVVNQWI